MQSCAAIAVIYFHGLTVNGDALYISILSSDSSAVNALISTFGENHLPRKGIPSPHRAPRENHTPIDSALDYCIKNHILEEFLKAHREEVLKVMTIDMTFEKREALMREETEQERKRADEQTKRADNLEIRLNESEAKLKDALDLIAKLKGE